MAGLVVAGLVAVSAAVVPSLLGDDARTVESDFADGLASDLPSTEPTTEPTTETRPLGCR